MKALPFPCSAMTAIAISPSRPPTGRGATWPVMLLGNCGGIFKTGCFTQLDGKRPINALYTTLLRTAGQNVDRFNMTEQLARKFDAGVGPLKEVLA